MKKSGKIDKNIISEISESKSGGGMMSKSCNVSESKSDADGDDDMEEKLVKESSSKESDTVKEWEILIIGNLNIIYLTVHMESETKKNMAYGEWNKKNMAGLPTNIKRTYHP